MQRPSGDPGDAFYVAPFGSEGPARHKEDGIGPSTRKQLIINLLSFIVSKVSISFFSIKEFHTAVTSSSILAEQDWLQRLSQAQPVVSELLAKEPEEQRKLGYF